MDRLPATLIKSFWRRRPQLSPQLRTQEKKKKTTSISRTSQIGPMTVMDGAHGRRRAVGHGVLQRTANGCIPGNEHTEHRFSWVAATWAGVTPTPVGDLRETTLRYGRILLSQEALTPLGLNIPPAERFTNMVFISLLKLHQKYWTSGARWFSRRVVIR